MREKLEYISRYQQIEMDLIDCWRTQKLQNTLRNGKDISIFGILK